MLKNLTKTLFKFPLKQGLPLRSLQPRFPFSQENKNDSLSNQKLTSEQIKTNQTIAENIGMNQFLMRVYNTTGLSILGALGSSFIFMSMPLVVANFGTCALLSMGMTLGGLIGASYMKPTNVVENVNGVEILKTVNSPLRIGLYSMGILGLGLGASPLFMMAQAISPAIMPTALGITTAIFGGASLVAYAMPKDKMLGYGGVLGGSLLGLIGLQVVGLLATLAIGPNPLSTFLFTADNYIGIGLFSAFIAYDTHLAIKMYEMKEADHLGMAIQFLLDFWNILIRVVSILSRRD